LHAPSVKIATAFMPKNPGVGRIGIEFEAAGKGHRVLAGDEGIGGRVEPVERAAHRKAHRGALRQHRQRGALGSASGRTAS
jgi:hypothetical protein